MAYVFPPLPLPTLAVRGTDARFPVHRIYCVGRNYADHAAEMGATVERGAPVLFCKPADAVVAGGGRIAYPRGTHDLHHEVELVIALGRDADGIVARDDAAALIYGYAVGLDLTRRDLQAQAKAKALPWDSAKGFDASAPVSELLPLASAPDWRTQRLWLEVGGTVRQQAALADMVWDVEAIVHELSRLFALRAGDLIYMGTPAGVAALKPGDTFRAGIGDVVTLSGEIVAA